MNNVIIENARIIFRNFEGKENGRFNPKGRRNFCVLLDEDIARSLKAEGWNVRYLKARDEDEPDQAYLQVAVSFGSIPPRIVLISGRGKTNLTEDTVNILDWAELKTVDVVIRPYEWEVNGNTGVKAYLKTLYVTIEEDEFERKYYDVPDASSDSDDDLPF